MVDTAAHVSLSTQHLHVEDAPVEIESEDIKIVTPSILLVPSTLLFGISNLDTILCAGKQAHIVVFCVYESSAW